MGGAPEQMTCLLSPNLDLWSFNKWPWGQGRVLYKRGYIRNGLASNYNFAIFLNLHTRHAGVILIAANSSIHFPRLGFGSIIVRKNTFSIKV